MFERVWKENISAHYKKIKGKETELATGRGENEKETGGRQKKHRMQKILDNIKIKGSYALIKRTAEDREL